MEQDLRISELPESVSITGAEILPIVKSGTTSYSTITTILNANLPLTSSGIVVGADSIVPATPQGASLGTADKPFKELFLQSGSLSIESDTEGVEPTVISNADGNILISAGGMQLLGSGAFVAKTGSFDYISGSMTQVGDYTQNGNYNMTGNKTITGSLNITGSLYINSNKQFNYGQFYDTTTQSGSANTAYAMKLNTTDGHDGVTVVSGSRITVATGGFYNLQFSAQFQETVNASAEISVWLRKGGVNVPLSNTELTIEKVQGGGKAVAAWNFAIQLNANEYVELVWSSTRATTQLHYHGTQTNPVRPETPSIIATLTQIA
jgi:hypothetical protein